MPLRPSIFIVLLALLLATARPTLAFDVSYWAWQRSEPLSEEELRQVAAQGVRTIYWQVGELENIGESWRWKARFPFPEATAPLRFVPIVRLVSREHQPFSEASMATLVSALAPSAKLAGELQLDYDAPDRLVEDYGRALARIHQTIAHLSITALPHWSRADYLSLLAKRVDGLFPMLYDFEAEPVLHNDQPQPLIAPEKMARMLSEWSACPKPWHAGLPTFARLTVYDADGKSRGQIRNWNWDEVCLNQALLNVSKPFMGTTLWRAQKALNISQTHLETHDQLAVRLADRGALRGAIDQAKQSKAIGVTFFRLPDSSSASGWSITQLSHLEAKPHLVLHRADSSDALILENDSSADLEPCLQPIGKEKPGYAIELTADGPIFRETEPGDFASVTSFNNGKEVAIPFATRVAFAFSHLSARQSLKTGLIQLAPGTDLRHARYRFRNLEGDSPWKSFD